MSLKVQLLRDKEGDTEKWLKILKQEKFTEHGCSLDWSYELLTNEEPDIDCGEGTPLEVLPPTTDHLQYIIYTVSSS